MASLVPKFCTRNYFVSFMNRDWRDCATGILYLLLVLQLLHSCILPTLFQLLFFLLLFKEHFISELVKELSTRFLLLNYLINVLTNRLHSLLIYIRFHLAGIGPVLQDRFLVWLIIVILRKKHCILDIAMDHFTVGKKLLFIINNQDSFLFRKLYKLTILQFQELRGHFLQFARDR